MASTLTPVAHKPLVAIVGPTGVGKSAFAIQLATRFPFEIVNADSRQVYRHMDIGTSKPSVAERALMPHHVFDVVDPNDPFSLADYQRHASTAISLIRERRRIPLLVGGSGQYIWSLLEGWQVPQVPPDPTFRKEMEQYAALYGHAALHERLAHIDADAAARIQPQNVRRVVRALELHHVTGTRPSLILWRRDERAATRALILGLRLNRAVLFARTDARLDTMVQNGLAQEVRTLLDMGYSPSLPSMSSIGYREMADFISGVTDLEAAVARIRRETRRLIRRQDAWFRVSDERIMWLDAEEQSSAMERASAAIAGAMR